MGGFIPKPKPKPPAPPPVPKPTVVETTASQAADAQQMSDAIKTKRKGRRATILTANEQLGGTSISKKTLLG